MKRLVIVVTVWAMGLGWVLISMVLPSDSASATATTPGGTTHAQISGGPAVAAGVPSAAPVRHHKTSRLCSTVVQAGGVTCFAIRQTDTVEPASLRANAVSPQATPAGYGPLTLVAAYKLDQSKGSGRTVAVVDAYDDPNAESDLAAYRTQYGLPSCTTANGCFKKVSQSGSTTHLPPPDAGWAGEISLDLDMVAATCPNCHILLVEATNPTITNLGTAVNRAVTLGAKYVTNSYGAPEDGSEPSYDSAYYHHAGVVITASSGDGNYGAQYPATGAYVTAVGGTSLISAVNDRGWAETVWNTDPADGTGSGCSTNIAKPWFQTNIAPGCSHRAEADVSAVADPNTGMATYNTYLTDPYPPGWQVYGGTSVASSIIASVYALAGTPGASDNPNAYPYSHTSSLFDVTTGNNGACSPAVLCTAGTGWDGPTGLGTPNGTAAFTQAQPVATYTRLAGADRYGTAVAISQSGFQPQSPAGQFAAMVASGANFPDALAAGPVAAAQDGPLLLVPQDGVLPPIVGAELARLNPSKVNIAGGTAAVSLSVETQLKGFGAGTVLRLAGPDRYGTAAQLAALTGGLGKTVFIATGASFPDALGGSAAAGALGGALMLTGGSALPVATASALTNGKPAKVVILGGQAVISPAVFSQVQALLVPGATVQRWSGSDRYDTAAAISLGTYPQGASTAYLASGADYPDALAGAPVAALAGAPLLLTQRDCVPASTLAELARLGATKIVVLGGTSAVSDAAANLTPCAG